MLEVGQPRELQFSDGKADHGSRKLVDRWGSELIDAGWVALPTVIIKNQTALELSAVDLNIVMALLVFWWERDILPWPSKATLSSFVGLTERTVQRHLAELDQRKLVVRRSRGAGRTNEYDLSGLVDAASKLITGPHRPAR